MGDADAKASRMQGFVYLSDEGKGPDGKDAAVFASSAPPRDWFKAYALSADRGLGYVESWHKHLGVESDLWPYEAPEKYHVRLMISPDDAFWRKTDLRDPREQSEALAVITRQTMKLMESATKSEFFWTAAAHVNTDHPHAHALIRGRVTTGANLRLPPKRRIRQLARTALWEMQKQIQALRDANAEAAYAG